MISKFLDPKNDFAFKKIFGTERNKDILLHFLNDMIVFKEKKPIQKVQFLKTVQDPEIAAKKMSIVDVLCEDEDHNIYIVEMQVANQSGFEKRAQYYAAKAYINQMNKGDNRYENLKEVIFLAIVDFTMFPDKEAYKSDHVILDQETYTNDLKGFSFTFLELKKFHKKSDELHTMIEKWAYYFKHAEETSERELSEIFKDDTIIQKAYEELNRFNWSEIELRTYERELKNQWDRQAILDFKIKEATVKGMEEGIAKGMEKCMEKGIEKGMEKAKIEIAKKMQQSGMPVEAIANIIGIPAQEIKKQLQQESHK